MEPVAKRALKPSLAALLLWFAAGELPAGTGVKVQGDVEEVTGQVEKAFGELRIVPADTSLGPDHALAVGKAGSGAKITVWVNRSGDDECEVSVATESPQDTDIEERFLRLMRTR